MSSYNSFIFVSKFEIYLYYIFYKKPLIIHLTYLVNSEIRFILG